MCNPGEMGDEFLLTHDPFKEIYKKYQDTRDLFIPYTAYSDTLNFTRIIVKRIYQDIEKSGIRMEQFFQISHQITENNLGKPLKTNLTWEPIYELELDLESLVIFSKILLDKFAIMIETIFECRVPDNYAKSFTKHKEWYVNYQDNKIKNNINDPLIVKYSSLLKDLHWYDQTLDFFRNKIVEHGGNLVGSVRTTQKGAEYRRVPKNFGFLENNCKHQDLETVKQMIIDYGKENEDIEKIQLNPATMLDEFLGLVLEYNIQIQKADCDELGQIVRRNGGKIDVLVLYKQVCKFLSTVASTLSRDLH